VYTRFVFRIALIALGIALLTAGLFFENGTASPARQESTPASTLDPFERLAKPTLPASPSQADQGAQDYWLYCLPCHGDRGQGLTLEFRETYPPDEVDCWQSGCHGKRPYDNGFTLPRNIPAVIGENSLQKFPNAAILQSYISAAMPYWKPGSLKQEENWRITAFLLRENGYWDAQEELSASNAGNVVVGSGVVTPVVTPQQAEAQTGNRNTGWLILIGSLAALFILLIVLKKSQNTTTI
jgi:LPXTG-motif cell wall-anchored protein